MQTKSSGWYYIKRRLHMLMTEPESSKQAYCIALLVMVSIIISTISFVLASVRP